MAVTKRPLARNRSVPSDAAVTAAAERISAAATVASEAASAAAGVATKAATVASDAATAALSVAAEVAQRAVAVAAEAAKGTLGLTDAVRDLAIAAGELKVTVIDIRTRATEDRAASKDVIIRLSAIEQWKSRIQGQVILLTGIFGTVFGAGMGALISHIVTGHP
jgi:colicin import membrane protein